MKKIGYTVDSYPERRNIINGNLHPVIKTKSINTGRPQKGIRLLPIVGKKTESVFHEWKILNKKDVDGFHFFNSVTNEKVPWISTFETYIPRTTALDRLNLDSDNPLEKVSTRKLQPYLEMMASKYCKKLIAISAINLEMENFLLSYFPEYREKIGPKLIQMHPPQEKLMSREEVIQKETNQVVKFLFVGKDFVRKGGRDIVDVFRKIKNEHNFSFELQIVSLGKAFNYAFGPYQDNEEEVECIKQFMKETDWITYHEKVPNSVLLEMMKKADVGLLPTWADTYGYSVLEFQASGCPVITTNIRALPELNSEERGWMINLPVNRFNEIRVKELNEKEVTRKELQKQLEQIVLNILQNPSQIHQKAIHAYDYVSDVHSVVNYMEKLSTIYEENF